MDKKQSVISNLIWRFMERCGAQVMSFVVSVVLARLLEPSLYGSIALVTATTSTRGWRRKSFNSSKAVYPVAPKIATLNIKPPKNESAAYVDGGAPPRVF